MDLDTAAASNRQGGGDTGSNDSSGMSLDAAIRSAFDGRSAPAQGAEPSAPSPSAAAHHGQAAPEDAPEGTQQAQTTTPTASSPASPEDGDKRQPEKSQAQQKGQTSGPASLKAWTPAERAAFEASPPEVQAAITRMVKNLEAGWTRKTQQLSQVRQQAEEIASAFEQRHLDFIKSRGVTPGQAVKDLLALHDFWANDPVRYVHHVMQVSGLTPEHLGFGIQQPQTQQPKPGDPQQSAEPDWVDPEVIKLRQQYEQDKQQLQREIHALRSAWTGAQQASVQEKVVNAQTLIERFMDEVDETGAPAHPHFEAVQPQMEWLLKFDPEISRMPAGPEKLQEAYDRATWLHPEARAARLEAEERKRQAIWEAQRTRSAATVKPKAAPAGGVTTTAPMTLDQMIRAAAQKHGM